MADPVAGFLVMVVSSLFFNSPAGTYAPQIATIFQNNLNQAS